MSDGEVETSEWTDENLALIPKLNLDSLAPVSSTPASVSLVMGFTELKRRQQ